jgi:hypothetical protein
MVTGHVEGFLSRRFVSVMPRVVGSILMRDRIFVHLLGWATLALTVVILVGLGFLLQLVFVHYGLAWGIAVGIATGLAGIGIAALIDNRGWLDRQ